jgi:DNA polymerase III epsilon subunit-like protein
MKILGLLALVAIGSFLLQRFVNKKRGPSKPKAANDFYAQKRNEIRQKMRATERPLFIHNETTGLIKGKYTPSDDLQKVPRTVQLAWRLYQGDRLVEAKSYLIKPKGYQIPSEASAINGITTAVALQEGVPIEQALTELSKALAKTDCVISHYNYFRHTVVGADYVRLGHDNPLLKLNSFDMMEEVGVLLSLESNSLNRVIQAILPAENFESKHDAKENVEMIAKAFFRLRQRYR